MGRSQESYNKKEVRNKKEQKRKIKEKKRLAKKDSDNKSNFDDMIAYVDENGQISSTPPDDDNRTEIELEDIVISTKPKDESEVQDKIRKGIVEYFSNEKAFGFIRDLETRESYFVHRTNTHDDIAEGNKVSFEIGKGPKGPVALEVRLEK
jgi:cold shock CspA family protein